jgi:pimeloyl-ACP methyl ester carboxylesterase
LFPSPRWIVVPTLVLATSLSLAQPPNRSGIRPVPPPGIALAEPDRAALQSEVDALGAQIAALKRVLKDRPELLRRLPDVQIFYNAVRYPLTYNEFFNSREPETARRLLAQGRERAAALQSGKTPWLEQSGLVVLGYTSRIDDSVQPYGMVVPSTWTPGDAKPRRLDFFFHGRGETLSELAFLSERQRSPGEFTPPDTFVLHPYGRYCCANRFAGEIDLFEALADAKTRYPIDSDRLVIRGFSMGGASCWQFATHYADLWAAAAPGAGFSETPEFSGASRPGAPPTPWYQQKLWHWYDPVDYAVNLAQCPTVAYSGEIDGQRQAANKMAEALEKEGLPLTQVIGPGTGHSYHPESKKEIDARLETFATKGREKLPTALRFTTWTLRYPKLHWLTVTGLTKHWERAWVDATLANDTVTLTTTNVTRLALAPEAARPGVVIDGQRLSGRFFVRGAAGKWGVDRRPNGGALRKKPGLQGPIDDAFLSRFVMVRPTGTPLTPQLGAWIEAERRHAAAAWRVQQRGEVREIDDTALTPTELAESNLVLWGDPSSNRVLARIAAKLPIRWEKDGTVRVGKTTYPAGTSVPVLIYPNPLNPSRYVVINSGLTWREQTYLNNSYQFAHLPDWAVVDITTPPDAFTPGRIADAGFFDESWKLKPAGTQ